MPDLDLQARREERAKQLERAMDQAAKATQLVAQLQGAVWELDQQIAAQPKAAPPAVVNGSDAAALASGTDDG